MKQYYRIHAFVVWSIVCGLFSYGWTFADNPAPNEVTVGITAPIIFVNDDDDNGDTVVDKGQEPVTGENDTKAITVTGYSKHVDATVTLYNVGGSSKIDGYWLVESGVTTTAAKEKTPTRKTLPYSFPVPAGQTVTKTLYIEGINASDSKDDVEFYADISSDETSEYAEGFNDASRKTTVVKFDLKSIEFTSDHGLLKKNPIFVSVWDNSYTDYESPEWVASSRSNPISHTKNTKISATVKIQVAPSGINFDLSGTGTDSYVDFTLGALTSTGADQDVGVIAEAKLPDQVSILNKDISWKIIANSSASTTSSSGTHKIYVTYGTPSGSGVTERRVQEVCTTANGKTSDVDCANAVFAGLSGGYDLNAEPWGPEPVWLLHDSGQSSQCPGLAKFVNYHFMMLGLSEGSIRFCHAQADGTYIAATTPAPVTRTIGAEHPNPTTHSAFSTIEVLEHWDHNGKPNVFEATCLWGGKHYALGEGIYNTPKEVVSIFEHINWSYKTSLTEYEECDEDPWEEAP